MKQYYCETVHINKHVLHTNKRAASMWLERQCFFS